MDIAPLLAYSLGLPVPSDFEGRVPTGIFTEDFLRAHPVMSGEPTQPVSAYPNVSAHAPALAEGEEAALLSRLKALGYVE